MKDKTLSDKGREKVKEILSQLWSDLYGEDKAGMVDYRSVAFIEAQDRIIDILKPAKQESPTKKGWEKMIFDYEGLLCWGLDRDCDHDLDEKIKSPVFQFVENKWGNEIIKEIKALLRYKDHEADKRVEEAIREIDNRKLTIKWFWNKEKNKLLMVYRQLDKTKNFIKKLSSK